MRSILISNPVNFGISSVFVRHLTQARGFTYANEIPPKWETGEMGVLKPKYRWQSQKLKMVVKEAESLGYIVLRSYSRPPVIPSVYPPKFKSEEKERIRKEKRAEKIKKALQGMEKRRSAMHKKDRDEKYAARMKGIRQYYPERRAAPKKKGNTR